jgi:hypothetical protein
VLVPPVRDTKLIFHLDQPLDKSHADCRTPRSPSKPLVLGGKPYQGDDRKEEFGFIKIKFEYPLDGQLYDAWIILPSRHGATHFDASTVEIIAAVLTEHKQTHD